MPRCSNPYLLSPLQHCDYGWCILLKTRDYHDSCTMVFENSALIIVDPNSKSISTKPCWISHSRSRYSHVAGAKAGGGAKAMEHHKDAHHMPGDRTGQYLVGGLEHVFFHSVGNDYIIPTDEVIFFRGVAQPPTRYDSMLCLTRLFSMKRM